MSDTHTHEHADERPEVSPGRLLQRARERQGIALEDAALALHLRPAVVAGLERDHYAEIPVATYRRGYLRTYARYLGIDEGPVLDAYRAQHGTPDAEREIKPVSVTRPPSRLGGLLFKLVTLLVIAGLIGVTVTWWQSRGGNAPPGLEETPLQDTTLEDTTLEDTALEERAPAESESANADSTSADDAATGSASPGEADAAATTDAANPRAEAPVAPAATPSDIAVAAATEVAAGAEEADNAAGDPNTLTLTFNQQSWTEIFDARNQRVLVGLQQPGTEASVEGQPPFRLTVGNATGVRLEYQGKLIDLERRAGANNVARFTLGD